MNRAKKAELLHGPGCLLVLIGMVALTILAFTVHLSYLIGAIALIVIYVFLSRRNMKEDHRLFSLVFDNAFESFLGTKPSLLIRNSYGFPQFTITFQSEGDMNLAEADGYLRAFKLGIADLCSHCGSKENPFDVDRAVYSTYVGRRYIY